MSAPASGDPVALDFYELRREGIGHLERTSSDRWTDFNTHDPGISILEALAYAITDLAYRAQLPVEDLIASVASAPDDGIPPRDQGFFPAREILTVAPTTPDDLRRLLVDQVGVRNAWVRGKACACDVALFAWCEEGQLTIGHDPSLRSDPTSPVVPIAPRGLYDVLLELDEDPELGDLNDRRIRGRRSEVYDGVRHQLEVELRLPAWDPTRIDDRQRLLAPAPLGAIDVSGLRHTLHGTPPQDDDRLRARWSDVWYVDLTIHLAAGTTVRIDGATVRWYGDAEVRRRASADDLTAWLVELATGPDGLVERHRRKMRSVDAQLAAVRATLAAHRSLDEDTCHVELVEVAEIAACADVEVEAGTDLELVQARIWQTIATYLGPVPTFRTLADLRSAGVPVEDAFDGPPLDHGFITADDLAAAELRSEIRISDLIGLLMDIEGVTAVDHLQLTAHDSLGQVMTGVADPTWMGNVPVFDPNRRSASWLLRLPHGHHPRLHIGLSSFHFTVDGLPFTPRPSEAENLLVQLVGSAARPKLATDWNDVPPPVGRRRDVTSYVPVQHGFPRVYGIGPEGLPSTATPARRAQAKQLQAYLLVFDQLLRTSLAQLAEAPRLFSIDRSISTTRPTVLLDSRAVTGSTEIVSPALTADRLAELLEPTEEFLDRRNRFLDHLLARFGESFNAHALALNDQLGRSRAQRELIDDKTAFARSLPRLGRDRGRAFDRTGIPGDPDNRPVLAERVNLRLGLPDWQLVYRSGPEPAPAPPSHELLVMDGDRVVLDTDVPGDVAVARDAFVAEQDLDQAASWHLHVWEGAIVVERVDGAGTRSIARVDATTGDAARALLEAVVRAKRAVIVAASHRQGLTVSKLANGWRVAVSDPGGGQLGRTPEPIPTEASAHDRADQVALWAAHRRAIVVEHLLLRPKFPGDALLPACADGPCCTCTDDDPYSFRLTYVMPGWTAPLSTDLTVRAFADETIAEEVPAHLLPKVCWVGDDPYRSAPRTTGATATAADATFDAFEEAWIGWLAADRTIDWTSERLDRLVEAALRSGLTGPADDTTICRCTAQILAQFGSHFRRWMDEGLKTGREPGRFGPFDPPAIDVCDELAVDGHTPTRIRQLLLDRYLRYVDVSFRLSHLTRLLAELRNTYPLATLHDCDEGADRNPVRLGRTALGSE